MIYDIHIFCDFEVQLSGKVISVYFINNFRERTALPVQNGKNLQERDPAIIQIVEITLVVMTRKFSSVYSV